MTLLRNVAVGLLVLCLVGCAASVRYAERVPGFAPGYVDQRLGEDTYQVKIGEAWPKDWPDLEKFALYRASEVTQKNGRRYFAILTASSQVSRYTINLPTTSTTSGTVSTIGSTSYVQATTTNTGGGSTAISGRWYTLEFKTLAAEDIAPHHRSVDSEQVRRPPDFE